MKRFVWIIFLLILVVFVGWVSVNQLKTQKAETSTKSPTPTQIQEETTVPQPVSESLINEQLQSFLPSIGELSYNGKLFCAHHLYGFNEDKENGQVKVYIWAYCEEYYLENNQLKMGFGVSEPVLATMELKDGGLVATSYREPGNGSLYASSIKEMFPEKYATEAINGFTVAELKPSPKEQAEAFYNQ
jgi:hypothetical protein